MTCRANFSSTTSEALGEKADMQHLNNCLADYIEKVRALKKSAALGLDPRDYQESMRQLENEVMRLKKLYEEEINRLRRKLDDAIKKIQGLDAENERNLAINQRCMELEFKVKKLEQENDGLKRALANAEKLERELRDKLMHLEKQCHIGLKWSNENDDLRKAMTDEVKRRQAAEALAKQFQDKVDFDKRLHDQKMREMNERIKAQNDIINALEKRLKELSAQGDNLPGTLQKMREANLAEMKRFQQETECALNKNMGALSNQLAQEKKSKEQLMLELKNLNDALKRLAARNTELEAQNKGLVAANSQLNAESEAERLRAQRAIADLEKKLAELQAQLCAHSKEFKNSRDAQASLRSEIEVYRSLLQQEGSRLDNGTKVTMTARIQDGGCTGACKTNGRITPNLPSTLSSRANSRMGAGSRARSAYQPPFQAGYHTVYRSEYTQKEPTRRY